MGYNLVITRYAGKLAWGIFIYLFYYLKYLYTGKEIWFISIHALLLVDLLILFALICLGLLFIRIMFSTIDLARLSNGGIISNCVRCTQQLRWEEYQDMYTRIDNGRGFRGKGLAVTLIGVLLNDKIMLFEVFCL